MEIMIATSIAMVLLFGALYSTSETLEVVREGDIRVHTNVNARRALDRLLKDCRYASEVEVEGNEQTGWTIGVDTTGTLAPGELEYTYKEAERRGMNGSAFVRALWQHPMLVKYRAAYHPVSAEYWRCFLYRRTA